MRRTTHAAVPRRGPRRPRDTAWIYRIRQPVWYSRGRRDDLEWTRRWRVRHQPSQATNMHANAGTECGECSPGIERPDLAY